MKSLLFLFAIIITVNAHCQDVKNIAWQDLNDVTFKTKWSKADESYVSLASFGESLLQLNGKKIRIKGYIYKVEGEKKGHDLVFLSRDYVDIFDCKTNADASSFMCIKSSKNIPIKKGKETTIEGILKLKENIAALDEASIKELELGYFVIKDAVVVKI